MICYVWFVFGYAGPQENLTSGDNKQLFNDNAMLLVGELRNSFKFLESKKNNVIRNIYNELWEVLHLVTETSVLYKISDHTVFYILKT